MAMSIPRCLDLDLLRSFVIIAEEKSFTRAAERVGRTQSAVSLQMQRLEAALGLPVLNRGKGGTVELNQRGQYLLGRAKELLGLNDDILKSLHAAPVHGTVRLGIADEVSSRFLPRILERFAQTAPSIEVQVTSTVGCALAVQLKNGEIDLAILESGLEPRQWPAIEIWRSPLRWITSEFHRQHARDPIPLCLSPGDCPWRPPWLKECLWRGMAIRALEQSGRNYRVVSTSSTTAAQLAATLAGLAVTPSLAANALPTGLRPVGADEGLPGLPDVAFLMLKAREPRQPMTDMLATEIQEVFGLGASDPE